MDARLTWYALTSRPQSELLAAVELRASGYDVLVPCEYKWRKVSNKRKRRRPYPILSRYVFIGARGWPGKERLRRQSRHVQTYIARMDGYPAELSVTDVRSLMDMDGKMDHAHSPLHRGIRPGDEVDVVGGAMKGHRVVVTSIVADKARAMFNFLNSLREVEIPLADIEKS